MLLKQIIHCARCGGDHSNVEAAPLTRPVVELRDNVEEVLYTHWAPCPTNGEPILAVELADDGPRLDIDKL